VDGHPAAAVQRHRRQGLPAPKQPARASGGGPGGGPGSGGPGGGTGPSWGFGEEASENKESLLRIQSDLQRALTSKDAQREEYETLLRERDLAGAKLREEHFRAEADVRAQALRADHAR